MRIQTRIGRQQRRVNIQNPSFVMFHKPRAQNAHETRKNEQVRFMLLQIGGDGSIEALAIRIVALFDTRRGDAGRSGARESMRVGFVAEDNGQVEVNIAAGGSVDK